MENYLLILCIKQTLPYETRNLVKSQRVHTDTNNDLPLNYLP